MAIIDSYDELLMELVRKDYIIYALKSAKQIKREYKELDDYAEFKSLTSPELVFVWWYACRCSPIADLPDEKRVVLACEKAFKSKGQAEARKMEYASLSFPPDIKEAIKRMDGFDPGGRITAMADDLHTLKQCQTIIRKDISGASMEEATEWIKAVKEARKMRDEILQRVERGGLGVEETGNVLSSSLEGVSSDYMKSRLS